MPKATAAKLAEWRRVYQEFMESRQSYKEFSFERGIPYWTLKSAIKRIGSEGGSFSEVTMPGSGGEFAVRLRNGRELRIPSLFSAKRVQQLIEILESC